jgi:hypothetical protein
MAIKRYSSRPNQWSLTYTVPVTSGIEWLDFDLLATHVELRNDSDGGSSGGGRTCAGESWTLGPIPWADGIAAVASSSDHVLRIVAIG